MAITHESLLGAYQLHLSRELWRLTRTGRSLVDCVAILIRTEGDPDIATIVSRADAREIAEVAGLDHELVEPPPPPHLHVFTFAHNTGSVRALPVRPMSKGGKA